MNVCIVACVCLASMSLFVCVVLVFVCLLLGMLSCGCGGVLQSVVVAMVVVGDECIGPVGGYSAVGVEG